jgi:hypothetical protein
MIPRPTSSTVAALTACLAATPAVARAQQMARGSLLVSARVVDGPSVRAVEVPREIGRDTPGATYAAALTVSGGGRTRISVAVERAGGPAVSVRSAGGAFQPLVPGGPAVVIADHADAGGPATVHVEYHVDRAARRTGAEPASLTYTVTVWSTGL